MIASILKPTDDVRAFRKLSQSIAKTNKYEVNIIGNEGKKQSDQNNINFHSHKVNRSDILGRLLIQFHIFRKILKLKPEVLIISTHELIVVSVLSKLIIGCKLIYDVQENYFLNLFCLNSNFFKKLYARFVRLKEYITKSFIDQYWLAEKCYETELSFSRGKSLVVENKALGIERNGIKSSTPTILFTGTISEYGGVRKAVEIFQVLRKNDPSFSLHIIGQIHDVNLWKWLQKQQQKLDKLKLTVSQNPVPHDQITEAIFSSTLGVIGYEPNRVTQNKIPTKLYEYSRYKLPYVVSENTKWSEIGITLGGAIPIDFQSIKADFILNSLEKTDSLFPNQYPKEATWENESIEMIHSFEKLIKQQ